MMKLLVLIIRSNESKVVLSIRDEPNSQKCEHLGLDRDKEHDAGSVLSDGQQKFKESSQPVFGGCTFFFLLLTLYRQTANTFLSSCFLLPGLRTSSETNVKPAFPSFDSVEVWCLHVQIFAELLGLDLFCVFCLLPSSSVHLCPSFTAKGKATGFETPPLAFWAVEADVSAASRFWLWLKPGLVCLRLWAQNHSDPPLVTESRGEDEFLSEW